MSKTIEIVKKFVPTCEQEEADKEFFIECENVEQILTRDNRRAHLTSSAFIVNKEHTKVLCVYHNIYKSWCWVGGHADGDDNPLYVAMKEAREETSISNITPVMQEPISIESLAVFPHVRRGKFVPAHIHLNLTFLLEADENQKITKKEDENSNVGWLTFDELLEKSTEPHMIPTYKKNIEKVKNLRR